MTEIDHSLKRLGIDYVDLYQIHRRDQLTPWEETLEALHDLVKVGKVRYLGASSMKAWEFSKALHLQKANGWACFVSLQDTYNLLMREEEREMLPLCADEGVQTIVYSPLARGVLARPWGQTTTRSETEAAAGYKDETNAESDRKIVEAVCAVANERGLSQANVALAWLGSKSIVAAPIIGVLKTSHIDDALAALEVSLTDEEIARLESPYTPRMDFQGVSDPVHTGPCYRSNDWVYSVCRLTSTDTSFVFNFERSESFACQVLTRIFRTPSAAADEGQRRRAVPAFTGLAQRSKWNEIRTLNMPASKFRVFPYINQVSFHVYRRIFQLYACVVRYSK